jgi:hypothetical protein
VSVVSAGVAEAVANTTTVAGFALVAAMFGASQEALTRFADHKATGLSDAAAP